jgi:methionine sulfoxide reductase heme-binding subunit
MNISSPTNSTPRPEPSGIRIRLWPIALAAICVAVLVAHTQRLDATHLERLRLLNSHLARLSFLTFIPIYAASPLVKWLPGAVSSALVRNRRSLGLAYALIMAAHLCAIAVYQMTSGSEPLEPVSAVLGGLGFVLIAALAATSNDAAVRRLGGRAWKRLHASTLHWLWAIYAFTYLGRVVERGIDYLPGLVSVLLLFAFRISARWRSADTSLA